MRNVLGRIDALRARGWVVAVHNDYRLGGEPHTFWLFTKGDRCAKGEGLTDEIAVGRVEAEIARIEGVAMGSRGRGRPRREDIDLRVVRALLREGLSRRAVGRVFRIPHATLDHHLNRPVGQTKSKRRAP